MNQEIKEALKIITKRISLVFLIVIAICFLNGCASSKVEFVYLPQKCLIPFPNKPAKSEKFEVNLSNLLIYTKELEEGLKFCTSHFKPP